MMRNKKLRTVFCGILIFLLVFALFCLGDYGIRYYHTPIKKDYDYTGTGMLVSLTEPIPSNRYRWRSTGKPYIISGGIRKTP